MSGGIGARMRRDPLRPHQWSVKAVVAVATLLLITSTIRITVNRFDAKFNSPFVSVAPLTPEEIAFWEEHDRAHEAGPHHKELAALCDVAAVKDPLLMSAAEAELSDSSQIIGIQIGNDAIAFELAAMSRIDSHIVRLETNDAPISVTYCDLVDCVRVLQHEANCDKELRVGGLDIDHQMVFLFEGKRYAQESKDLPMTDYTFTRAEFGAWKREFPATRVYVGNDKTLTREM